MTKNYSKIKFTLNGLNASVKVNLDKMPSIGYFHNQISESLAEFERENGQNLESAFKKNAIEYVCAACNKDRNKMELSNCCWVFLLYQYRLTPNLTLTEDFTIDVFELAVTSGFAIDSLAMALHDVVGELIECQKANQPKMRITEVDIDDPENEVAQIIAKAKEMGITSGAIRVDDDGTVSLVNADEYDKVHGDGAFKRGMRTVAEYRESAVKPDANAKKTIH